MNHTDRELLEQPAQQWIKCSERLPGKWENVLVYDGDYIVLAAFVDGMWMPASAALPLAGITHWMPLPQPPEDQ